MNLFKNSDAELEVAFDLMEGKRYWQYSNRDCDRYSALGVRQALLAQMACSPNWDGCFVIYGAVGLHRYIVGTDGEIKYSLAHGRAHEELAIDCGFELFK